MLVTTGFDRITDRILGDARGKQGRAYFDAIDAATKAAVAECEREAGTRCSVANMDYGTDFYLIRQLELRDIRLVYAPPEAIGNYGDEIDNFMWPRHSGDFTLLRAYVGKDGKPADYAPDNVPYAPPAHLQVSTRNVQQGDFAMLAGYPGVTFRHRMASEFKNQIEWQLPSRVALFDGIIDTVDAAAKGDKAAQVAYASQVQSMKNNLKRAQGELDGLRRSDAVRIRNTEEAALLAWLDKQPDGAATRKDIDAAQALLTSAMATRDRDQLVSSIRGSTQLLKAALTVQRRAIERTKPDAQRESGYQERDEALIVGSFKQVQRRYDPKVEKAILAHLLAQYRALPAAQHVPEIDAVFGTTDADAKTQARRALRRHQARRRNRAPCNAAGCERRRQHRPDARRREDAVAGVPAPRRREQAARRRPAAPASCVHARAQCLQQVAGPRGVSGCELHAARELRQDHADVAARRHRLSPADDGAGHRREAHGQGAVRCPQAAARCDREGRLRHDRRSGAQDADRRPDDQPRHHGRQFRFARCWTRTESSSA